MIQNPTYQEVKLVHPEIVDVAPLAAQREETGVEELVTEIGAIGGDKSSDGGGERGLIKGFVGVPEAKEEALPDLEESRVGERGERREERGEQPHATVSSSGLRRGKELGDRGSRRRRRPHRRYIGVGERKRHAIAKTKN